MSQIVTPLPSIGEVIPGQDVAGRSLRISGHPESDRVVLSIWQDGRCMATVRVARADVPDLTHALIIGALSVPDDGPGASILSLPTRPAAQPPASPPSSVTPAELARRARTIATRLLPRSLTDRFARPPRD